MVTGLSVLVTSYNSAPYLEEFEKWVDGVITYVNQLIIVDDCSDDGSEHVLNELAKKNKKIELIKRGANSGRPSIPRNVGLAKVISRRMMFLDIGDLVPFTYVEFLSLDTTEHCYSGVKFTSKTLKYNTDISPDFTDQEILNTSVFKYKNTIMFSGASLPSAIAKDHFFLNEYLEDWKYWLNIVKQHDSLTFIRLRDLPVFYDTTPSLSPKKFKQLRRVGAEIGPIGLAVYCVEFVKLKFLQLSLERRCRAVFSVNQD